MLTTITTELTKAGHKATQQNDQIKIQVESNAQRLGHSLSGLEIRFGVRLQWDKEVGVVKIKTL